MAGPLLRPNQLKEYEEVQDSLEAKLNNKHIQNKQAVRHQLKRVERDLESQAPKEFPSSEIDAAVKETDELQEKIALGMPSHEEMRKCPSGAINKHMQWEKRNKENIQRWKTNKLRLNVGTDDPDVANMESFRPEKSQLNMQDAYIPGQKFYLGQGVGVAVVFSTEDLEAIKERAPDIYPKLCLMDADQRAIVKMQYVTDWEEEDPKDPFKEVGGEKETETDKKSAKGQRRDTK